MVETNVKGDVKNILIVTQENIENMQHFPLELLSLFDPKAFLEYERRAREAHQDNAVRHRQLKEKYGDELPF